MSELSELYQEVILDHSKRPRNFHAPEHANRHAEGHNPLCGDRIEVSLQVEDGVIRDLCFQGSGCAISTASASMMTEILKGRREEEARDVFAAFKELVTGRDEDPDLDALGKLAVFGGVRQFPMRVKCATLAWHTAAAAMKDNDQPVTTE
jgi:nitrogen fixation protein NifU and related proteins